MKIRFKEECIRSSCICVICDRRVECSLSQCEMCSINNSKTGFPAWSWDCSKFEDWLSILVGGRNV